MSRPVPGGLAAILQTALRPTGHGAAVVLGAGGSEITPAVAQLFAEVVAVEPDPHLAPAGERLAAPGVHWVQTPAEEVHLAEGEFDAAFLGSAFQWMDRPVVARRLHHSVRPGGHVVMVTELADEPDPASNLPTAEIDALVARFAPVAPQGRHREDQTRRDDAGLMAAAGLIGPQHYVSQDLGTVFWDVETVMAYAYARSHTAPHLFGYGIVEFDTRLRELLAAHAVDGGFVVRCPPAEVHVWTRP